MFEFFGIIGMLGIVGIAYLGVIAHIMNGAFTKPEDEQEGTRR